MQRIHINELWLCKKCTLFMLDVISYMIQMFDVIQWLKIIIHNQTYDVSYTISEKHNNSVEKEYNISNNTKDNGL